MYSQQLHINTNYSYLAENNDHASKSEKKPLRFSVRCKYLSIFESLI